MVPLPSLQKAIEKSYQNALHLIKNLRQHTTQNPNDIGEAIKILENIRNDTYEELNQIQHELLVIKAAEWLIDNKVVTDDVTWFWNPRQTGGTEPDLVAKFDGYPVISAEVTTSKDPNGVIDSRMKNVLKKLNEKDGKRFYFIRTESMKKRAETKVMRNHLDIEVILLK